jgi:signal transduction histidine kinase
MPVNNPTSSESDILYATLNKLTQAETPAEQLEAVSDYARSHGATGGQLFYVEEVARDEEAEWVEVVAEWAADDRHRLGVGRRLRTLVMNFVRQHMSIPVRPVIVGSIDDDLRIDTPTRELMTYFNVKALVQLPLNSRGRWIGALAFTWNQAHRFNDLDTRIYTALVQQATPVIDSIRLLEQARRRARDLEAAHHEIDSLYTALHKLTQATTPLDQLEAVSDYARSQGASQAALLYIDQPDQGQAVRWGTVAAEWAQPGRRTIGVGTHFDAFEQSFSRYYLSRSEQPTLVEDMRTDRRVDPTTMEQVNYFGLRGAAILPLRSKGRWVGILWFVWDQPYPFGERDERLYTALMQQAAPVIGSLRAYLAAEEARRESDLLYRASKRINAANTPHEIVRAVEAFSDLWDGIALTIWENYDFTRATYFEIAAATEGEAARLVGKHITVEEMPFIYQLNPNEIYVIENVITDARLDPVSSARMLMLRTVARISVPLTLNDRWMGALVFYSHQPRTYTDSEKRLVTGIGDLATAALERIRLQVETEMALRAESQRALELEAVAKVSATAASALDVTVLLHTIVELSRQTFLDYRLAIFLLEADRLMLAKTDGHHSPHTIALDDAESPLAATARTRQSVIRHVDDPAAEARSEMMVPMVAGDHLVGVLCVRSSEPQRFSESDLLVMSALADLIAVAVQNARLYAQAQELAAVEERNRLARELHDSVSQALYGIALGARTAHVLGKRDPARLQEPLDYILTLSEAALTEMRALIFDLRPDSLLESEGLISALTRQTALIRARHNIGVSEAFGDEPLVPIEAKESLYRIAREALHNAVKHARASHIRLRLDCSDGITLAIADDGIGFDPAGDFPGHLGLRSMRERVAKLGGSLQIESTPGSGTHIAVYIPGKH